MKSVRDKISETCFVHLYRVCVGKIQQLDVAVIAQFVGKLAQSVVDLGNIVRFAGSSITLRIGVLSSNFNVLF